MSAIYHTQGCKLPLSFSDTKKSRGGKRTLFFFPGSTRLIPASSAPPPPLAPCSPPSATCSGPAGGRSTGESRKTQGKFHANLYHYNTSFQSPSRLHAEQREHRRSQAIRKVGIAVQGDLPKGKGDIDHFNSFVSGGRCSSRWRPHYYCLFKICNY